MTTLPPLAAEIDRLRADLAEMTRQRNLEQADAARSWNTAGRLREVNAALLVALESILSVGGGIGGLNPENAALASAAVAKARGEA